MEDEKIVARVSSEQREQMEDSALALDLTLSGVVRFFADIHPESLMYLKRYADRVKVAPGVLIGLILVDWLAGSPERPPVVFEEGKMLEGKALMEYLAARR